MIAGKSSWFCQRFPARPNPEPNDLWMDSGAPGPTRPDPALPGPAPARPGSAGPARPGLSPARACPGPARLGPDQIRPRSGPAGLLCKAAAAEPFFSSTHTSRRSWRPAKAAGGHRADIAARLWHGPCERCGLLGGPGPGGSGSSREASQGHLSGCWALLGPSRSPPKKQTKRPTSQTNRLSNRA
jgi:hypothetical protein